MTLTIVSQRLMYCSLSENPLSRPLPLVIVATLFFVGEPGIDEGGPKREFLCCCLMLFQTIAHFLKVPLPEGCYGTTQAVL